MSLDEKIEDILDDLIFGRATRYEAVERLKALVNPPLSDDTSGKT